MAVTSWLIDKSAYVRLQLGQVANRDEWSTRISRSWPTAASIAPCQFLTYGPRQPPRRQH
jgi:hypothetical protein